MNQEDDKVTGQPVQISPEEFDPSLAAEPNRVWHDVSGEWFSTDGEWRRCSGQWNDCEGEWHDCSGEWIGCSGLWHNCSGQWSGRLAEQDDESTFESS